MLACAKADALEVREGWQADISPSELAAIILKLCHANYDTVRRTRRLCKGERTFTENYPRIVRDSAKICEFQ